jgi:hypothetical protein
MSFLNNIGNGYKDDGSPADFNKYLKQDVESHGSRTFCANDMMSGLDKNFSN